jgi:Na+-transporting methylmalonyl-CoA/oxaloacetate decarboxylase gamma subunit
MPLRVLGVAVAFAVLALLVWLGRKTWKLLGELEKLRR